MADPQDRQDSFEHVARLGGGIGGEVAAKLFNDVFGSSAENDRYRKAAGDLAAIGLTGIVAGHIVGQIKKDDIGWQIEHADLKGIQSAMDRYKDDPKAFRDKFPEIQKALKERGITAEYKVQLLLGDYKGTQPYGSLTLRRGENQISILTNGMAPETEKVTDLPGGGQRMDSPRPGLEDPEKMLKKIVGESPPKNRIGIDWGMTAEEKALNNNQSQFDNIAPDGAIKSSKDVDEYLRTHKDISDEEAKGWRYLANHFDEAKGASKNIVDHIFHRDKHPEGVTSEDVRAFLQKKMDDRTPQVFFVPI